jgi:hypothetical protein
MADAFAAKREHPKESLATAVVLANGGGISLTFTFPFIYAAARLVGTKYGGQI